MHKLLRLFKLFIFISYFIYSVDNIAINFIMNIRGIEITYNWSFKHITLVYYFFLNKETTTDCTIDIYFRETHPYPLKNKQA